MHELSIMEGALNQVLAEARKAGAQRVREIRLRLGALSSVVPEALQFAFEALSEGTLAEHAQLTIERVPARFWCGKCQQEFESAKLLAECPTCQQLSRELRTGREMELVSMEID